MILQTRVNHVVTDIPNFDRLALGRQCMATPQTKRIVRCNLFFFFHIAAFGPFTCLPSFEKHDRHCDCHTSNSRTKHGNGSLAFSEAEYLNHRYQYHPHYLARDKSKIPNSGKRSLVLLSNSMAISDYSGVSIQSGLMTSGGKLSNQFEAFVQWKIIEQTLRRILSHMCSLFR